MSRIETRFKKLKDANRKGLVTFVTAGDPSIQASNDVLDILPEAGADFIEVGMPFSDPMADGPAIQASSLRALENGMNVQRTLDLVKTLRTNHADTPIVLMGYYNPIYKYGCEQFIKTASENGVDGLIIVDLPPEEDHEIRPYAEKAGIDIIRLITPTTVGIRLDTVLDGASGFLYYVSITGVTGTKSANIDEIAKHMEIIKSKTDLPVAVGFGIRTPEDAANMSKICDGVIVGSAIVQTMSENKDNKDMPGLVSQQVKALSEAI